VIIGGGIVGCSIAYHLGKMGWKDILLLEKSELTSGATWHAAGLVGQLRPSRNLTRMLNYSVELYNRLEAETGQSTGWAGVGSLRIAASEDRMMELKRLATAARSFGLPLHLLGPKETHDLFPVASPDGIVGSAFIPSDGYADPSSLAHALAKGARSFGVTIRRNTAVTGITVKNRTATEVMTTHGPIKAEIVVNAAGMWAREVGRMAGVIVPVCSMEHQYLVTETIEGLPNNLPTVRDPDGLIYYKPEVDGLVMGGFEPNPIPWGVHGIPKGFNQQLLEPNFEQFEILSNAALKRTPCLGKVGIRKMINGPDGYSPDGNYILGPAPELSNYYVAAGMNCFGIAGGGGVGRALAEWIVEGEPGMDLWPLDIRRFSRHHASTRFLVERTAEHYGRHYTIHWPGEESHAARGIRRSPLYNLLKQKGAVFGEKVGWERVNWFAPEGVEPVETLTWGYPNWFDPVGNEHRAVRERVGLIDMASFSKIEVRGPKAFEFLQRLAAGNLDKPVGSLTYTQLCNERGGIECDLTVARLAEQHFYLVTGTAFSTHDLAWIERHLPEDGSAIAYDVTSSRSVIGLWGPRARLVLEKATDNDVSNDAFKFGQCKEITIGCAPVLALRVTYIGELGWELHIPTEYTVHVYEELRKAGEEFGMIDFGYRALESMRLEKGYRYWTADITPDYNPYEAGLGFCVSLDKGNFLGREALAKVKAEGPKRKLSTFTLDVPVRLQGGESIRRDGKVLGVVTSGGFGYSIGKTIAYGYLPADQAGFSDYEIEAFRERYPAARHDKVLYDPDRKKILS
jgi:4-methylaminobutanoate oxidase (formaldehyde-forming)